MALQHCRLNCLKNSKLLIKGIVNLETYNSLSKILYSTEVTMRQSTLAVKKQKVSKAMKSYLERAKEHDKFMKTQHVEYKIGKRHLANMMGEDPETFTQEDIDNAISYLFPSGIFDRRARPAMKSPEEVYPARKAAEFDESGRPFHSFFYTGKPNFFKLLHDIATEINQLSAFEERILRYGHKPDSNQIIDMSGLHWLSKDKLENMLVEKLADIEYNNFVNAMGRLVSMPYSYKTKDFINKYTKPLMDTFKEFEIPKPKIDEDGRQYVTTYECMRKSARGDITLRFPGSGTISINGKDITYFEDIQQREQVLFPIIFAKMMGKVDIEANVHGGGPTGQAGAIRWGIAMSLQSFVDEEMIESMRLAGLLTQDWRRRERKKFGQEGARRKYTWKKR